MGIFERPSDQQTLMSGIMDDTEFDLITETASIVAAYVSHNTIVADNLPNFITSVHAALSKAAITGSEPPKVELIPAVPIKKSVTADYIVCLEDGKKFKSLKRHLRTRYNMSPQQYREKWGLSHDYPMVAPSYAAARSHLAKTMGLGQRRQAETAPAAGAGSNSKGGGKRGRAAGARRK
jgi:predicted transcriptional regulator